MMEKRILSLLLAVVLVVALLAGCGSNETVEPDVSEPTGSGAEQPSADGTGGVVETPVETPAPAPSAQPSEPAVSESPETAQPEQPSAGPDVVPETPDEPVASPEPPDEPSAPVEPVTPTPSVTPAPSATPAPAPSAAPSGVQAILNAATLSPMKTNDAELDAMVEKVLNQITTDDMTTYEKVKACYDYLMQNTVYQTKNEPTVIRSGVYVSDEDYKVVLLASEVLSTGKGVCDHYAAALHVLTRRIGLESYICTGKHASQKGGLGGHVWTIITVNGTDYIFDAQIDDYNGGKYDRFCKTFAEMGSRYQDYNPANNKAQFADFRRVSGSSSSSSPSSGYGETTLIDDLIAYDEVLSEYFRESVYYSRELSREATQQVRLPMGLSEMTIDPEAVKVACFCAVNEVMGWSIPVEEIADYLFMQGVDFRYVTTGTVSGGILDPAELVLGQQEIFSDARYDGVAAGFFEDLCFVILYGK